MGYESWRIEKPKFHMYVSDCLIDNPDRLDSFAHWLRVLDIIGVRQSALRLEAWGLLEELYSTGSLNFPGCGDIVDYIDSYIKKCKECVSGKNIVCHIVERDKCVSMFKDRFLGQAALFLVRRFKSKSDIINKMELTPSIRKYLPESAIQELRQQTYEQAVKQQPAKPKEAEETAQPSEPIVVSKGIRVGRRVIMVVHNYPSCIPDRTYCGTLLAKAPLDKNMLTVWRDKQELQMDTDLLVGLRFVLMQIINAIEEAPGVSEEQVKALRDLVNENTKPRMTFSELRAVINPVTEAYNTHALPLLRGYYPKRMHPEEALLTNCAVEWLNCFIKVVKGEVDP